MNPLDNLSESDKWRLGVISNWHGVPHQLTYRQVEYTFSCMVSALQSNTSVGESEESNALADIIARLVQASIPKTYKNSSTSYAIDWTDVETFASPVSLAQVQAGHKGCADADASWGHRNSGGRSSKNELFLATTFHWPQWFKMSRVGQFQKS